MKIVSHGPWTAYEPHPWPEGFPPSIMWCRNTAGQDWYDYQKTLDPETVKCTVRDSVVQAVYRDASKLFPQGCILLELFDADTVDVQKMYGGMWYDTKTNTLCESHA
jgi:hypothetical protein